MAKQAKKLPLTLKQRESILLTPCKTPIELKNWIKFHLGLVLPDHRVSRYADSTPFDAIWEAYEIMVLKHNPKDIKELLYVAGRGSGKTMGMAIVELLAVLHDHRDVVHVGAIMSQADRCYDYVKKFLYNKVVRPVVEPHSLPEDERILEKCTISQSLFNIAGEKISLEILPCTLKACLTIDNYLITSKGNVKVDEVCSGDKLLSPLGEVEVLNNKVLIKECMMVELEDGRVIRGTLDHKVWTNRGWVMLKDLQNDDEVLSYMQTK